MAELTGTELIGTQLTGTHIAFLSYLALMVLVLFILLWIRTKAAMSGVKPNTFSPTGEDLGEFSKRLVRTHANIYEFFPLFGGVLLYAIITDQTNITNGLALVLLGARLLQSLTHLVSTSVMAVQLRFFMFLVQIFIVCFWLLKFFGLF